MLFQGQEFGSSSPFFYFADHNPELAGLVSEGRKLFLKQFRSLATPEIQGCLADPSDLETFERSKLDLSERKSHSPTYELHRDLLKLRRDDPTFRLQRCGGVDGAVLGAHAFVLRFFGDDDEDRLLLVNLGMDAHINPAPEPLLAPPVRAQWSLLWSSEAPAYGGLGTASPDSRENWRLPAHSAIAMKSVRRSLILRKGRESMSKTLRTLVWPGRKNPDEFLRQEWLVTNGLGGYASGTIAGVPTRRFHGLLVAALPAPLGRIMMLNHLSETLQLTNGRTIELSGEEPAPGRVHLPCVDYLAEFRLQLGLPVWRFEIDDLVLEKQIVMPHHRNTVHVIYKLLSSTADATLLLHPEISIRAHEGLVSEPWKDHYAVTISEDQYEVSRSADSPTLRLRLNGEGMSATFEKGVLKDHFYRVEARRGYDSQGVLWCPGQFKVALRPELGATFSASTESWETISSLSPDDVLAADVERKSHLFTAAATEALGRSRKGACSGC